MSDESKKVGAFCWNELMTPNVEQAKEFYGALLGWQWQDMPVAGNVYTIFTHEGKDVAGMMLTPPDAGQIPPHWMSYIMVDDLDDCVNKSVKLGATIAHPIKDLPNYGRFAVIQDPTGAHIAFWQQV